MSEVRDLARRARMAGLSGNFLQGHEILDQAQALVSDDPVGQASIAIERGRLHNSAGSRQNALPYFLKAWELAEGAGDHNLAVDAAHMMAIASDLAEAEHWTQVGLARVAAGDASAHWAGMLHHNLGWTYFEAERFDDALACFRRDEAVREAAGTAQTLKVARYAVIRTLRALRRYAEAIALGEQVVALADAANDQAPFVCEELAECHAASGNAEASRAFARRAHALLAGNPAMSRDEPARLERLAALAGIAPP